MVILRGDINAYSPSKENEIHCGALDSRYSTAFQVPPKLLRRFLLVFEELVKRRC